MEWISVKDMMPPLGVAVLVFDRYGSTKTGGTIKQVTRNKNSCKQFYNSDYGCARYSHWMPLPKLPKE